MIKLKDLLKEKAPYKQIGTNKNDGYILHGKDIPVEEDKNPRVPRKKGQPAGSKKHSDLYTDENPKGTIKGLKFATVKDAKASVSKINGSGKKHAHKIQAAVAMEQRAREMGKTSQAAVYRAYINKMKKITKKRQKENIEEKCWKGYEKKGTKMMFGKRYPNCVKKKKKSEEKISEKVNQSKVNQAFTKGVAAIRKISRTLNDDDNYAFIQKLEKWLK